MQGQDEDDGFKLPEFSKRFAAYCRCVCSSYEADKMGMPWQDAACQVVAERTGEPVSIVQAVCRGQHDASKAMLDDMDWFKYEGFEMVWVRQTVTKYLPKKVQIKPTTIRTIYPLY